MLDTTNISEKGNSNKQTWVNRIGLRVTLPVSHNITNSLSSTINTMLDQLTSIPESHSHTYHLINKHACLSSLIRTIWTAESFLPILQEIGLLCRNILTSVRRLLSMLRTIGKWVVYVLKMRRWLMLSAWMCENELIRDGPGVCHFDIRRSG